jgi:hypothetical protein
MVRLPALVFGSVQKPLAVQGQHDLDLALADQLVVGQGPHTVEVGRIITVLVRTGRSTLGTQVADVCKQ